MFPSEEEDKVIRHSEIVGCWHLETVLMGALEEGVLVLSLGNSHPGESCKREMRNKSSKFIHREWIFAS